MIVPDYQNEPDRDLKTLFSYLDISFTMNGIADQLSDLGRYDEAWAWRYIALGEFFPQKQNKKYKWRGSLRSAQLSPSRIPPVLLGQKIVLSSNSVMTAFFTLACIIMEFIQNPEDNPRWRSKVNPKSELVNYLLLDNKISRDKYNEIVQKGL